jgi:hypothetical protein
MMANVGYSTESLRVACRMDGGSHVALHACASPTFPQSSTMSHSDENRNVIGIDSHSFNTQ